MRNSITIPNQELYTREPWWCYFGRNCEQNDHLKQREFKRIGLRNQQGFNKKIKAKHNNSRSFNRLKTFKKR